MQDLKTIGRNPVEQFLAGGIDVAPVPGGLLLRAMSDGFGQRACSQGPLLRS